jgi:hypothetical protein
MRKTAKFARTTIRAASSFPACTLDTMRRVRECGYSACAERFISEPIRAAC